MDKYGPRVEGVAVMGGQVWPSYVATLWKDLM